jgi:hypothetical protein
MPARPRDIKRALEARGVRVDEPTKGSHWKAVGSGGKVYPVPAHNGLKTEIGDEYIRGICRAFGFDFAEFRREL